MKFPQIGPRTLTAAVVLIGLASSPARSQDEKKEADPTVAEIQKLGGKVERDDKAEGKPVTVVNFATTQIGDDALKHVEGFAKLQKLTLNGTKVTDAGLDHLKGLKELAKLYLVDTKITDAGLERLKGVASLKILSLVGTEVTDAGLEQLKGLTKLQEVFLYGTKVTDEGAKKLKEALPNVKIDR